MSSAAFFAAVWLKQRLYSRGAHHRGRYLQRARRGHIEGLIRTSHYNRH